MPPGQEGFLYEKIKIKTKHLRQVVRRGFLRGPVSLLQKLLFCEANKINSSFKLLLHKSDEYYLKVTSKQPFYFRFFNIFFTKQAISKLEQAEKIDDERIKKVADALGVTEEGLRKFNEERVIYSTVNFDGYSGAY